MRSCFCSVLFYYSLSFSTFEAVGKHETICELYDECTLSVPKLVRSSRLYCRSILFYSFFSLVILKVLNEKMTSKTSDYIVWIDMELSGLDVEKDTIIEIGCIITDKDLKMVIKELNIVINHPDNVLETMGQWCTEHHTETGLLRESRSSQISLKEAEQMLLNFLISHVPKGTCPLAGNTIYMDRIFLFKLMPSVNDYLHYRIIDVSSIKELARRWNPVVYRNSPKKKLYHRALIDIKESIQELQYYKDKLFISEKTL